MCCATSTDVDQSNEWPIWPEDFKWFMRSPDWPESHCLKIEEPGEDADHTWSDNWFCARSTKKHMGWRWDYRGPISGMRCTHIAEPSKPVWNDNYFCVPEDSPYHFTWSYRGVIENKSCIAWRENSEEASWNDNFLCANPTKDDLPNAIFPDDFVWTYRNTVADHDCIKIHEPEDNSDDNWHDNYLCWKNTRRNPRMRWSLDGAIDGMRCVKVHEPSDSNWRRNFLCVPTESDLRFVWHYRTPNDTENCIKVEENSEENYWKDNYLCTERCRLVKVDVLNAQDVVPKNMGTRVVGVATAGTCTGGNGDQKVILSHEKTEENSLAIEMGKSNEVNYALSTSVQVEASGTFLGTGVSVTLGLEHSFGYGHTWSTTNVTGSSTSDTSGSAYETVFSSPGAAMIVGLTDEMKINNSNIPIRQHFECENGVKYQRSSTMKMKATTYQATHYETLVGKFKKKACKRDRNLPNCVQDLKRFASFIGDFAEIRSEFDKCFANGKGRVF